MALYERVKTRRIFGAKSRFSSKVCRAFLIRFFARQLRFSSRLAGLLLRNLSAYADFQKTEIEKDGQ